MIVRVWARAMAAGLGPVVVAAGEAEIVAAVEKAGGRAVLTDPGPALRLRPHLGRPEGAGSRRRAMTWWSICRAICRRWTPSSSKTVVAAWPDRRRYRHPGGAHRQSGRRDQSRGGQGGGGLGRRRAAGPGAVFHPRHRARRRGRAVSSCRALRLSPRSAGELCRPAAFAPGEARKAGAAAGAGSGHEHCGGACGRGAFVCRYSRRFGKSPEVAVA